MNSSIFVAVALASVTHQGPTVGHPARALLRFRMLHMGKQMGTAAYERVTTATERHTMLTIDESDNGVTLSAVIDTLSKRDGTPEKKSFHGLLGNTTFSTTATFNGDSIQFKLSKGADPEQSKTIPIPANAVLTDASETWFDKTTPKAGDKVVFTNFNVQTGSW